MNTYKKLIVLGLCAGILSMPQIQGMNQACTGTATTPAPAPAHDQKKAKEEAQTNFTPLARLYTKLFLGGISKDQWRAISATLLPIVLEPIRKLQHQGGVRSVAWHPAGTHVATASSDNTAALWDTQGNRVHTLKHNGWVFSVAWHPAGTHVATASTDNTAALWDTQGNRVHTLKHNGWVFSVAWHPAGTHVATASDDGTAALWDTQGNRVHTLKHNDWVRSVAWHPAGTHVATASSDNTAALWDTQGNRVHTLKHNGWVFSVAWHPAGTHVATASTDNTAALWDTQGNRMHTLKHNGLVRSVAWHPAGTHVATASDDGTAALWDTQGNRMHTLKHNDRVLSVAWHPAGTHVATASNDDTAALWDVSHMRDAQYNAQHAQLQQGTLLPSQLMLIHVLEQYKKKQNNTNGSLKHVAQLAQTPGITTAVLAQELAQFNAVIMRHLIKHYGIADAQNYIEDVKRFDEVKEALFGIGRYLHAGDEIEKVLGEYIVEAHPVISKQDNNDTAAAGTK